MGMVSIGVHIVSLVVLCGAAVLYVRLYQKFRQTEVCAWWGLSMMRAWFREDLELRQAGMQYYLSKPQEYHPYLKFLSADFECFKFFDEVERLLDEGAGEAAVQLVIDNQSVWRLDTENPLTPRHSCILHEAIERGCEIHASWARRSILQNRQDARRISYSMDFISFVEQYAKRQKKDVKSLRRLSVAVRTIKVAIDFTSAQEKLNVENGETWAVRISSVRGMIESIRVYGREHQISLPDGFEVFESLLETEELYLAERIALTV